MTTADRICHELQDLPEQIAQEVLDFAKFLKLKNAQENLIQAQAVSMNAVWNNTTDDVWNHVSIR